MIDLIEQNRAAIADLCRKFKVQRLDVFGSATSSQFDPARSDIDFIYTLQPVGPAITLTIFLASPTRWSHCWAATLILFATSMFAIRTFGSRLRNRANRSMTRRRI